jgi:phospholipid-binding lipoprotein MlaA
MTRTSVMFIKRRHHACPLAILLFVLLLSFISFGASPSHAEEISDPIEPINRGIFWLNDKLDVYLLEPVAIGYDFVTPRRVQSSVSNFFRNLNYPIWLVADLLQLNFTQAGKDTARFLINTTFGFYGAFDVAESHFEITRVEDDLGVAFGRWGVPFGPYLVLPFFGPSSVRDGVGLAGESFLSPTIGLAWANTSNRTRNLIIGGMNGLMVVNLRARLLDPVRSAKEASLDYYSFVKQSFYQRRYTQIHGEAPPVTDDFDDDDFEFEHADESED